MSSDHEKSIEKPNESNEGPKAGLNGSPPPKKLLRDNTNVHAKRKRRRKRGKKGKQLKRRGSMHPGNQEECKPKSTEYEKQSQSWDDDDDVECEDIHYFNDKIIRPLNVPKAPQNSTQFIINDHNECNLYMSFETPKDFIPNYCRRNDDNSEIMEPVCEYVAYEATHYKYEPPHDFYNSAYSDWKFEQFWKNNRFDELMRLPQEELISGLQNFENRLRYLNEELVKEEIDPILDELQSELLELQKKKMYLQKENACLNAFLEVSGVERVPAAEEKNHTVLHSKEIGDNLYLEESTESSHPEDNQETAYYSGSGDNVNHEEDFQSYQQEETEFNLDEYGADSQNLTVFDYPNNSKYPSKNDENNMETTEQISKDCYVSFSQDTTEFERYQKSIPSHQRVQKNFPSMDCVNMDIEKDEHLEMVVFGGELQISKLANHNESHCVDSYNEHIPTKEKVILRNFEYSGKKHEEVPLGAVPEEYEQLNAVADTLFRVDPIKEDIF